MNLFGSAVRYSLGVRTRGCWGSNEGASAHSQFVIGPDQVKAMGQALDEAWEQLAPSVDSSPEAIEVARFALADIILGLATQRNFDAKWLADTAVNLMLSQSNPPGSQERQKANNL